MARAAVLLALAVAGCEQGESSSCAPAAFPQTCFGYAAEFTVNGEPRREHGALGVILIDDALPEKRYYSVGTLANLELNFPRSQVGPYDNQSDRRVSITYNNGDRYTSNCGVVTITIGGVSNQVLWGRFEGPLCGDGLLGSPSNVRLDVVGTFTAYREDP